MSNNLKATCPKCKFEYIIPLDRDLIRTLPQNSLYWGVYIKIIAEHLGYFPDELHEEFKAMFNAKDSKLEPGQRISGSTMRLTRKEFTRYLEDIRNWAMIEHEIDLPERDETKAN